MPRFVSRERKHKKIARAKLDSAAQPDANSNAQEIVPESREAREVRRDALRQELRAAQPESKVSSKKRKRLEKYIDTKLKKDENAELLKKLEAHRVDTSLFQSSKKLGRVTESKRERLQRALRERDAGIDVLGNSDAVLFEPRADAQSPSEDDEESDDDVSEQDAVAMPQITEQPAEVESTFGSGLKRPLDVDERGRPVIRKRKRRKTRDNKVLEENIQSNDAEEGVSDVEDGAQDFDEEEWEGFGTDDASSGDEDRSQGSASPEDDRDPETDSESSSSSNESFATSPDDKSQRLSAFKAWADSQRNAALEFTPSTNADTNIAMKAAAANFKPRAPSPDHEMMLDPVPIESSRPAAAFSVSRAEDVQKARLELPVVQEEQRIMEYIHTRPVVVICGATGSGKTTQVPQMLLENGYASTAGTAAISAAKPRRRGMIGVTQPRRVAATSVASRVAHELGTEYGNKVAHQVRYDTNVRSDTMIKFMTDGILLREIQQDFSLSRYSVIVLDEAHERSVNTDLLIGMLSRIVPLRVELAKEQPEKHDPLKLIIMSATLSHGVDSFLQNQKLWGRIGGPPPIVEAEGRQFPVTVHFARKTRRDFLSEVVEKVARGHRKLPPGGMLVFLTGQQEILTVAKNLRDKLGGSRIVNGVHGLHSGSTGDDYEDGFGLGRKNDFLEGEEDLSGSDSETEIKLDDHKDEAEFEIDDSESRLRTAQSVPLKPHLLPLYAALPAAQQLKVFQPAPDGHRTIILATNVAETSLTIPGIRYVIDSGRVKEKRYDISTGVQTFEVDWVSKASAEQRKGRAGRTGPGHVWRLYSSAVYEEFFAEETVPEILRTPLESTLLQLKAMEIENVVTFPFPTPPEKHQLEMAERLLANLGAIAGTKGLVTDVGRELMRFPVSPRYGKMLLLAKKNHVVAHAAAIVAALAVGDLTVPEMQSASHGIGSDDEDNGSENERAQKRMEKIAHTASQQRHQAYTRAQAMLSRWDDRSDAIKMLVAVALHAEKQQSGPRGSGANGFCQDFFLREKGMEEVQMLRRQLHNLVSEETFPAKLPPPSGSEPVLLNQIVAAGFIDQVAIRTDALQGTTGFGRKPRRAIEVPYRTLFPTSGSAAEDKHDSPEEEEIARSVFIHPSSVLAKLSVKEMPQFVVYSHLSRVAPSVITGARTKRTRMHPLTALGPRALAALAEGTPLLQYGKPVGKIEELPRGDDGKQRRQCWVSLSLKAPGGSSGAEWPLGAWKVVQKRGTRDWEVDMVVAR